MQGGILCNQDGLKRDAGFSWLDVRPAAFPLGTNHETCLNEGEAMAGTEALCAGVNVESEVGVKGSDSFTYRCEG